MRGEIKVVSIKKSAYDIGKEKMNHSLTIISCLFLLSVAVLPANRAHADVKGEDRTEESPSSKSAKKKAETAKNEQKDKDADHAEKPSKKETPPKVTDKGGEAPPPKKTPDNAAQKKKSAFKEHPSRGKSEKHTAGKKNKKKTAQKRPNPKRVEAKPAKTEKQSDEKTVRFVDRNGDGIHDGKEHRFRRQTRTRSKGSKRSFRRRGDAGQSQAKRRQGPNN
jgi:hypothetical protein